MTLVQHDHQVRKIHDMAIHEQVTEEDKTRITENWRNQTTIPEKYKKHNDEFLQPLSEFQDIWDRHLGPIKTAGHRIKLMFSDKRLAHSDQYNECSAEGLLAAEEIRKMLQEDVIVPANTEWTVLILFATRKDGSLMFCVNY